MKSIETLKVFKALANKSRLRIVRELKASDEVCVCDLVKCCRLGWSTVSRHLSVLRGAGIITYEKRGQQMFYRLALPCVIQFISCLDDLKEPQSKRRVDCGCE